jgi:hypothetical protein
MNNNIGIPRTIKEAAAGSIFRMGTRFLGNTLKRGGTKVFRGLKAAGKSLKPLEIPEFGKAVKATKKVVSKAKPQTKLLRKTKGIVPKTKTPPATSKVDVPSLKAKGFGDYFGKMFKGDMNQGWNVIKANPKQTALTAGGLYLLDRNSRRR